MQYYTPEALTQFDIELSKIPSRAQNLQELFVVRRYRSEAGAEYGKHGIGRRLPLISRCIYQIFSILPVTRTTLPNDDERQDATIFIQNLLIHIYAIVDNLAFVWMHERHIKKPNGQPIPNGQVGFNIDKKHIWASLPTELQDYFSEPVMTSWFLYLENFRHTLAHRIPLYIPPYSIDPKNVDLYNSFDNEAVSMLRKKKFDEYERLIAKRDDLTFYRPLIAGSPTVEKRLIAFHAQVIADFITIEDIAKRVLEKIDS